jgi:hypothetical protein
VARRAKNAQAHCYLGVEEPSVGLALLRVPLSTYTPGREIFKNNPMQSRKSHWWADIEYTTPAAEPGDVLAAITREGDVAAALDFKAACILGAAALAIWKYGAR